MAWKTALKYPEKVKALIVLNQPHPSLPTAGSFVHTITSVFTGLENTFLGIGGPIARWKAARDDYGWLIYATLGGSKPGAFSKERIQNYKEVSECLVLTDKSFRCSRKLF